MRIIPKKSKTGLNLFKSFGLTDFLVAAVFLGIAVAVLLSNLPAVSVKLPVGIALLGLTVILMLGDEDGRWYMDILYLLRYLTSRRLYKKISKRANVGQLVPFLGIDEDGIVEYGDYYGIVLNVGTTEFSLLDEFDQNRRISELANALSGLAPTSTVQLVKIDRPINYDEVSAVLYEKLEAATKESNPDPVKIAVLKSRLEQIDAMNNLSPQFRPYYYLVVYDNTKEDTINQAEVLRSGIMDAGIDCERMDLTESAVFFIFCYSRNFDERRVYEYEGTPADYVKPESIRFRGSGCECDGVYSFTCAISDYPLTVGNAWGASLFNIDNTKVVMTIKSVEKKKALKRIDTAISEIASREHSKVSKALDQTTQLETMGALLQSLQNENESLFDCTLTVTAFNNTGEKNSVFRKEILRKVSGSGLKVNRLTYRQLDGFITAGISRRTALRKLDRGINSESLAAIFPFVFTSNIDPNGVTIGSDYYPVILDVWKRGELYNNSNMVVIGKSGSGKSYFTSTLITMQYSDNVQAFILDPENEYNVLCRNVGGKFIDVGNASEGRINPLQIYQILTDDGTNAPPEAVYSSHLRFLEDFFRITLPGIATDSLEELNNLVGLLYSRSGITPETDVSEYLPSQFPTFDGFVKLVDAELKTERTAMRLENLTRIRTYIEKFASGGRYAQLWNGASTLESNERFIVFNFQSLFESKNAVVSNAQMLLILRFLEQKIINIRELNRSKERSIHPLIAIDEGYNFIDPNYPVALDFIRSWFKRIRKYNGSMMFLTQNLSDILGNAEIVAKTSAIINNSQYSFIFSLAPADVAALTELYALSGGINETERGAITTAKRGDCFAILSGRERAMFHVIASEVVESMFTEKNAMELIGSATQSAAAPAGNTII